MKVARSSARFRAGLFEDLVVDNFAGGGGASLGIERALGRPCDLAINHDAQAIAMHRANHPGTEHLLGDVWDVDPLAATKGRPVALAWFSPDCKHFSKAKGGRPVSKRIRGLAWVVIKWAKLVRPRVIMLENVEEFTTWGPLAGDRPCPERKGETFRRWVGQLQALGYDVEWRELRACDYGAPTIRKRLFLIARCDGLPIRWPEATHCAPEGTKARRHGGTKGGSGRAPELRAWRTAAEIIDWSLPCPSIFERSRPLAENTLKRIARGIQRFVIDAAEPFIVACNHGKDEFRGQSLGEPIRTITTSHSHAVVAPKLIGPMGPMAPVLVGAGGPGYAGKPVPVDRPMGSQTTENHKALVGATLVQTGYGEREGQQPRVPGLDKPLGTVVAGGSKHALVSAWMVKHFGGMTGVRADTPLPTITARGTQNQLACAFLTNYYTSNTRGGEGDIRKPMKTITAGGLHVAEVRAFLVKYYGQGIGQGVREPVHTVTTKDRLGLVTVHGEEYAIADIGMRMLQPRELYRAQGFDDDYVIDPIDPATGKPLTKTAQVRMCGNSVVPALAEALVRANVVEGEREAAG